MTRSGNSDYIFSWAAFYGFALGALILSGKLTSDIICLFCRKEYYTLGNFGEVWANWHAFGCIFVGLTNFAVARDISGMNFKEKARSATAFNTAIVFGVWGCQNLYYSLYRQDLFMPFMWLHAILCTLTAGWALVTSLKKSDKPK